MTYVSIITLVTYALVLGLLAVVSVIDVRSRRVPNVLAGALGLLWVAWRVVLGFAGAHMGLGFRAEFLGPAPDVLVPPGLEIGGISFASGILGAVVLGGGLLVLTACVLSVAYVFGREIGRRVMGRGRRSCRKGAGASDALLGRGRGSSDPASASEPFLSGAIREVTTEQDRDSLLAGTMPFAPFIALGTLVAFVA